ncbi:hypothetical protein PSTT_07687 [Puccinia striiformis]|uniref:BZIP domain-containing protein n=1 Tax=Puccinia striiformis TaxID=27350 RepID=A0A2S4VFA1_9BASI|nr:hypothetical protein PSTT_07687 [Puccinia striiformis]
MSTEDNPIEPALLHPHLFNDLNNGMIEFPIIAYDPFHPINNKTYHSTFIDQSTPSWPSDPFLPFDYQLNTTADQLQLPTSDLAVGNQLGLDIDATSFNNPNSIECWIDFTGGESSSSSISGGDRNGEGCSTSRSSISSCSSTTTPPPLSPVDHQSSSTADHSITTDTAEPLAQNTLPDHQAPTNRANLKRQCVRKLNPSIVSPCPSSSSSELPIKTTQLISKKKHTKNGSSNNPSRSSRKQKINEGRNEFLERNRLAASRSRAKKKTYQTFLEDQARRLEAEHVKLNQIIQDLIVEKNQLQSIVMDRQLTATTTLNHHH